MQTCGLYFESLPLHSVVDIQQLLPSPLTLPISHLAHFTNSFVYTVCLLVHPYIILSITTLKRHLHRDYKWVNPARKGGELSAVRALPAHFLQVSRANITYQTFLPGNQTHYFEVNLKAIKQEPYSQGDSQVPPPQSLLTLAE